MFPVTAWGRAAATILMLLGIGFVAVITASVAAYFVENTPMAKQTWPMRSDGSMTAWTASNRYLRHELPTRNRHSAKRNGQTEAARQGQGSLRPPGVSLGVDPRDHELGEHIQLLGLV